MLLLCSISVVKRFVDIEDNDRQFCHQVHAIEETEKNGKLFLCVVCVEDRIRRHIVIHM